MPLLIDWLVSVHVHRKRHIRQSTKQLILIVTRELFMTDWHLAESILRYMFLKVSFLVYYYSYFMLSKGFPSTLKLFIDPSLLCITPENNMKTLLAYIT